MQKQTVTKRLLATSLVLILAFGLLMPVTVFANDSIRVEIDGRQVTFTPAPMSVNGRTMLPLRAITESLGMTVAHDPTNNTVIMVHGSTNIIHQIGTASISVNGAVSQFDTPSMIADGSTFVPVRMLAEAIGAAVEWDGARNTVVIDTRGDGVMPAEREYEALPVTRTSTRQGSIHANSNIDGNGGMSWAIQADGSVWGWGINWGHLIGSSSRIDHYSRPVRVFDNAVSVVNFGETAFALRTDGSLWGWGHPGFVGNGSAHGWVNFGEGMEISDWNNVQNLMITPVRIMDNVVSIASGNNHMLAITADGGLYGWGFNPQGQLGNRVSQMETNTPTRLMDNVVFAAGGNAITMAITNDGNLWAWGNGDHGLLLDGRGTDMIGIHYNPTPRMIMNNVSYVSIGGMSVMAVRTNGDLYGWGAYWDEHQLTPVRIMENVVTVSHDAHTMVVTTDSVLYTFGNNEHGQLGNGQSGLANSSDTPIRIMDNVVAVSAGGAHSLAVTDDGVLWAWGANRQGYLGDGTTTQRNIPTRIMDNIRMP